MADRWLATYRFEMEEAFPANDRSALYVMRLTLALNDLRIAAKFAVRRRQVYGERLYFVRLLASHLREVVLLIDPPSEHEAFLDALPRGTKPPRTEIRKSHAKAMTRLNREMKGRPDIEVRTKKGMVRRPPKLRDDLRELRNRFFHYHHDASGTAALQVAMEAVKGDRATYVIRERTLRADHGDLVSTLLAHPYDAAFAPDMHDRIVDVIGPIATYIQQVQAAWFYSRPPGVVTIIGKDRKHRPMRLSQTEWTVRG